MAHSALEVTVRAFYALHDTMTPVVIGISAMLLNILLSLWWINYLSYGGLALANSVATTIEALILLWLLRKRMSGLDIEQLIQSGIRTGLSACCMGMAIWIWYNWIIESVWVEPYTVGGWLAAIGGIAIAVGVYGAASFILNREELRPALAIVARRR